MALLIQIQEWDVEIYALKDLLKDLPLELTETEEEVRVQKGRVTGAEGELKRLQLKQKEKEVELQTKEEHVRKYEGQLTQVKTNKEYSSLQSEIKSLRADASLVEESAIDLMDQVDLKKEKVDEERRMLKDKEELLQKKTTEVNEQAKMAEAKMGSLEKTRSEKIKLIHQETASFYERIVRNKRGLAMVQVRGENCPACQIQLRPQVINEIKLKTELVTCENCSRILYE